MSTPAGFQTVLETFKRNCWNFQAVPDRPFLHAYFNGHYGTFRLTVAVDDRDDLVQIFGFVPLVVPPHKLAAMSELCVRLSWNLKLGRFELDHTHRQLRFHIGSAYLAGDLNHELVARLVGLSLLMVDQHFPAVIAVLYGDASPEHAVEQVRTRLEKGPPEDPLPQLHRPSKTSLN